MLKITTPSRLHMTLIDMNASRGRVDGSIGLTLDKPRKNLMLLK
jgi:beta-ribofuranosylaminobenzene 5'-phosphate synthase